MKKVLVTGSAGFIGFHLVQRLLDLGLEVVGIDNLNDYYDPSLKEARLLKAGLQAANSGLVRSAHGRYSFLRGDIASQEDLEVVFQEGPFDCVCHLAAQAGVRYSLERPLAYVQANIVGTTQLLEACRRNGAPHFLFASSSSVYGLNEKMPFSVHDNTDHPVSIYAASKKASELVAHSYSHLFQIPATGLRFFTVYGPWGRPDMALFLFTRAILNNEPIQVFNNGQMQRDFTYIDDIITGIVKLMEHRPSLNQAWDAMNPDPASSSAPYRIHNIGNSKPTQLLDYVRAIEAATGKTAVLKFMPPQPGDVLATWADTSELEREIGFKPDTPISHGVHQFVSWFREYYRI